MSSNLEISRRNQWRMVIVAMTGIGLILLSQAAYMEVFSYSVVTRNIENGILHVDITYVNPISSFFPVFLVSGVLTTAVGLWKSRNLLSKHRRPIQFGLLLGTTLTLLSAIYVQHQLSNGPNEYYNYGLPLPWLVNVIVDLPFHGSTWFPTPWLIDDLLFWAALVYLATVVFKGLEKPGNKPGVRFWGSFRSSTTRSRTRLSRQPFGMRGSPISWRFPSGRRLPAGQ